MITATPTLLAARADLRSLRRRGWLVMAAGGGVVASVLIAVIAAFGAEAARTDRFRTGASSLLLLGGLVVAVGVGATALNRDADNGFFGLVHIAGIRREAIGLSRVMSRVGALLVVVALWAISLQAASVAIGRGLDGPLAVHTLAMAENLSLVTLVAIAGSTVLGATTAGVIAVGVNLAAQAFANLRAAAEQGLVATVWRNVVSGAYLALPRIVDSPLIADLRNRGEGGPIARRFEINGAFATVQASGIVTVLWTLLWCGAFAALAVNGTRGRSF